jgi:hypothetical protein
VLCVTASLADVAALQRIGAARQVVPLRIGRLDAEHRVSEWVDYRGQRQDCEWLLVFDCFEPDIDGQVGGVVGAPIGFGSCGAGEPEDASDLRWYFGPDYQNMYINNDMEFDPAWAGRTVERLEVAWYWWVSGLGTGENMAVIVETYEDFDYT